MTPRLLLATALLLAGVANAEDKVRVMDVIQEMGFFKTATSPEPKAIKDWFVGCDNTLTCMAIAAPAEGEAIAYLRIDRAVAPGAAPVAYIVVYSEGPEGDAALAVTVDGKPFAGTFKGTSDGTYARAALGTAQSAALVAAIVNAKSMTLQRTDGNEDAVPVSLEGSSAALRFIDAEQKRDGGVTALVAKGDKPASAMPPAPEAPVVVAIPIIAGDETPDFPTAGLPKADPDYCPGANQEPIVFKLSDGNALWGVCLDAAAYNYQYGFYLVTKAGKVSPLPTGIEAGDTLSVTNPYRSEDGKVMRTFAKGRGLGDCGGEEGWSWDGKTMQRVLYKSFNACRGISSDDWIVSYRATVK